MPIAPRKPHSLFPFTRLWAAAALLLSGATAVWAAPPPAPENVFASLGGFPDQVYVTWTSSAGATSYDLYRRQGINNPTNAELLATGLTETTYYDGDVQTGTPGPFYYYWVKARNADGTSGFSPNPMGANGGYAHDPNASPPNPPTNVRATDGSFTNRVRVTWNASAGATGYEVWRHTINQPLAAARIATGVASTAYNDTSAVPGTTYYYWLKADNASGVSGFSAGDTGYASATAPPPPEDVLASIALPDRIEVVWTESPGATKYRLFRKPDTNHSTGATLIASNLTATSYTDTAVESGRWYYYFAKAQNANGVSGFSPNPPGANGGRVAAAPASPSGVGASDGTHPDRVRVSWNAVGGATAYEVWRDHDASVAGAVRLAQGITATTWNDFTAAPGTTYYYWVRATNFDGASGYGGPDTGFAAAAPAAPEDVFASLGAFPDKVAVSWSSVPGATAYELWRRLGTPNSPVGAARIVASTTATSHDDTTVETGNPGPMYYYFAKAKNAHGTSGFSPNPLGANGGYAQHAGVSPPATPTGVTASDGTYSDRVLVEWNAVANADSYEVWRALIGQTPSRIAAAVVGTTFHDFGAAAEVIYTYQVKATNSGGSSDLSLGDAGYRSAGPPPPPASVQASDGTYTDRVRVTWSTAPGATAYEVWRANSALLSAATRRAANVTGLAWNDSTVATGQVYYYWVKAKNAVGTGAAGGPDSGFAQGAGQPPAPPEDVLASLSLPDRIEVFWAATPGATSWDLYRRPDTNHSFGAVLHAAGLTTTSFVDTPPAAEPGRFYYYFVKAKNAAGSSGFSPNPLGANGGRIAAVPNPPGGVSASDGDFTDRIRVTWNPVAGASGYDVYRDTDGTTAGASRIATDVAGPPFVDDTAAPGIVYSYWLKARNTDGVSGFSAPDTGFTSGPPPAPENVFASLNLTAKIAVVWDAVAGATAYDLYRRPDVNNPTSAVLIAAGLSDNSYEDTDVDLNRFYYYFVKARTGQGTSGFSPNPLAANGGRAVIGPQIVRVEPSLIPMNRVTTVTVFGEHFDTTTTVSFATEGYGGRPGDPAPLATLLNVSADGTELRVRVDTSDPEVEGFHNLVVQNSAGIAAEPVRIVPPEPVVDLFSPGEVTPGDTYLLTVVGANLAEAGVSFSDPEVQLISLENQSDDVLTGLIDVGQGTQLGNLLMAIHGLGGSIELEFENLAGRGEISLEMSMLRTSTGPRPTGEWSGPRPGSFANSEPIWMQQPTLPPGSALRGNRRPELSAGRSVTPDYGVPPESISGRGLNLCFSVGGRWRYSLSTVLVRFLDPEDLQNIPRSVLDQMVPGEILSLLTETVALFIDFEVSLGFRICTESATQFQVCFSGRIGVHIPGIDGWIHEFPIRCFGTSSSPIRIPLGNQGFLAGFSLGSTDPCISAQADFNPTINPTGRQPATLERLCCNGAGISADLHGNAFGGEFGPVGGEIAQIAACPGPETYDIEVRAFIPVNHLLLPTTCETGPLTGIHQQKVVSGDDREFDSDPATAYRQQQLVSVVTNQDACKARPELCDASGLVIKSDRASTGRSSEYAADALDNEPVNTIDAADRDGVPHDCHLWLVDGFGDIDNLEVNVTRIDSDHVRVRVFGGAANPLVPLSPEINWDVTLHLFTGGTFVVNGEHDCYPGHEIYINDHHVYGYLPPINDFAFLASCLVPPMNEIVNCEGIVGQAVPCLNVP